MAGHPGYNVRSSQIKVALLIAETELHYTGKTEDPKTDQYWKQEYLENI